MNWGAGRLDQHTQAGLRGGDELGKGVWVLAAIGGKREQGLALEDSADGAAEAGQHIAAAQRRVFAERFDGGA